jgi:hypothetical protein
MVNTKRAMSTTGQLSEETRDCRKAKEDAHRIAGVSGSAIVYRLAGPLEVCRLDAFFPGEIKDFRFSLSETGVEFKPIPLRKETYFGGAGDYDYWKPVRFEARPEAGLTTPRLLKIEFGGEAQIGRVEIKCGFD